MKNKLTQQLVTRSKSSNFNFLNMLPDPDTILQKTGKHIESYRDLISDSHLFSTMQQRISGITSLKWELQKSSNQKANDLCQSFLNNIDLDILFSQILDAVFYGYSVLEIIWKLEKDRWLPQTIEEKPQEWFYFDADNQLKYRGSKDYNANDSTSLPENKIICVQHSPTYFNPYGEKILSKCYWPIQFKRSGLQFWLTFTERYGMPFLIANSPVGASPESQQALMDSLESLLMDTTAIIPADSSVKFLENNHPYSVEVYKQFVEFCNAEISKAVLSQTLTTEVGKVGTYAAAQTHYEILSQVIGSDKKLVEKTLNDIINLVCGINFGKEVEAPKFFLYADTDVKTYLAARDEILQKQGINFTKEYYMKHFNLKEEDFNLKF